MKAIYCVCWAIAMSLGFIANSYSDPIPIKDFARRPEFSSVALSPDGRFISFIRPIAGSPTLVVIDRHNGYKAAAVLGDDPEGVFHLSRCNWANNTRLLCGYRGMERMQGPMGSVVIMTSRLVAVNHDGLDRKVLVQNGSGGASQFQDNVLDFTPDEPDTVLIAIDDNRNGFPSVMELNIYTGKLKVRLDEREPIRQFYSDGKGNVRLAQGFAGTTVSYFARLADAKSWTRLDRFKAFSEDEHFTPVSVIPGTNIVYATGLSEGRTALWEMDLTDRENPKLLFAHPQVDVAGPLITSDRRMVGVAYETDRPFIFYTDSQYESMMSSAKKLFPIGSVNVVEARSLDDEWFVIQSSTDIDAGSHYLFERKSGKMSMIGAEYPELLARKEELGRKQSIRYTARDGTEISGYLMAPANMRAENLPLIVMPHGGPTARDSWVFSFLEQFLVSRGYAVLQMNFRGSSGYGDAWLRAAHQDWGGLTYDDIVDGAKWAIDKKIADPKRICTVGWSFGGYAALVGAVRNSDLYRCSVSIAGIGDLSELVREQRQFARGAISRQQIGVDGDKLKRDSPKRHAKDISIPVLLIHGDKDAQAQVDQSRNMARELKSEKKDYKYVEIKDADHQMSRESDRVTLLTELETFLAKHLGATTLN